MYSFAIDVAENKSFIYLFFYIFKLLFTSVIYYFTIDVASWKQHLFLVTLAFLMCNVFHKLVFGFVHLTQLRQLRPRFVGPRIICGPLQPSHSGFGRYGALGPPWRGAFYAAGWGSGRCAVGRRRELEKRRENPQPRGNRSRIRKGKRRKRRRNRKRSQILVQQRRRQLTACTGLPSVRRGGGGEVRHRPQRRPVRDCSEGGAADDGTRCDARPPRRTAERASVRP